MGTTNNLIQGFIKSNISARNQTYEDFKSNPTLGGSKPKNLTTISNLLKKRYFPSSVAWEINNNNNAIIVKGGIFPNNSTPARKGRRYFHHMSEELTGESGIEASDDANPKSK